MATTTELQAQLLSQASSVIDAVSKAASAAADQLPEIAMQYIMYGRAVETASAGAGVVLFLIGLYVCIGCGVLNWRKFEPNSYGGWSDTRSTCTFIGGMIGGIGFIIACVNAGSMLLVWFAPKVWLIKEIVHLLK